MYLNVMSRWAQLVNPSSLLRILADDSKTMSRNQDSKPECLNQCKPKRSDGETFHSW